MLAILQQKEAELEQRNVELESKDTLIAHLNEQLAQIIADRNIYKTLTDELLRLGKVQRFAAKSEKHPLQLSLFDEAELDVAIGDLCEQVPEADKADDQEQATLPPKPKTRQRGFAASLPRPSRVSAVSFV